MMTRTTTTTGDSNMPADADDFDSLLNHAAETTTSNAAAAEGAATPASGGGKPRYLVPGIDAFLGHGYDVFGEYASPNSVKARIYDLPSEPRVEQATLDKSLALDSEQQSHTFVTPPHELKLIYARPERVGYSDVFEAKTSIREIDTSDKNENNWGVGATLSGSYGGFSGEISSRFDKASAKLATTKCLQAIFEMVYWKLDLNNYTYGNPPPISDDVKRDFAEQPTARLIDKYGTHVLAEIGIGTRIVHSYTIDTSKLSKSFDIKASVKAHYGEEGASVGGSTDSDYHNADWNDRSAVSINITGAGVSDAQLDEITDLTKEQGEHPLAVLKQGWHNPTLVRFYPSSLNPIWEIDGLMTAEKAEAFKAAFIERAKTARSSIGALFKGLRPLYLFSQMADGRHVYRFSNKAHYSDPSGDWTIWNQGKPWLYTSDQPREGLAPLRELALNDNKAVVRYETDFWIEHIMPLNEDGFRWTPTGNILGYVHESKTDEEAAPENAEPVYAYYGNDLEARFGLFYSHEREIVWDQGAWKPSREIDFWEHADYKRRQAELDAWWAKLDVFTKQFKYGGQKPAPMHATVGPRAGVYNPMFSSGVPHWFGLSPGA
jgi:hypothetical protein